MKKYELIEHTSDIGIEAYGSTLAEAFTNAARGMFSIIVEIENVRETKFRRVEVNADDIEGLLFEWLNSLLYLFDVDNILLSGFDMLEFGDSRLTAECRGEKYDSSRHKLKSGVKSATYHMLEVDRQENRVRVIFDI